MIIRNVESHIDVSPLMLAEVSLQKGRGSAASTNTDSLLKISPKTAIARPLFWVWFRKLPGLWDHKEISLMERSTFHGILVFMIVFLSFTCIYLRTLEDPFEKP